MFSITGIRVHHAGIGVQLRRNPCSAWPESVFSFDQNQRSAWAGARNNRETVKYVSNKAPVVRVEGDTQRTVEVGKPLDLVAIATDDGMPDPKPAAPRQIGARLVHALGLRVAWFVDRGAAATVRFEPEQFKVYPDYISGSPWTPGWAPPPLPADGKFPVRVTFSAPGSFVLRVMAHDEGLTATQDVTVTVKPASYGSGR